MEGNGEGRDPREVVAGFDQRLKQWQRAGGSTETCYYVKGKDLRVLVDLAQEALTERADPR